MNGLGSNLDIVFPPLFSKDEIRCVIPNKKIVAFEPYLYVKSPGTSNGTESLFEPISNNENKVYYLTKLMAFSHSLNSGDQLNADFNISYYGVVEWAHFTAQFNTTSLFGTQEGYSLRNEINNIFVQQVFWRHANGTQGKSSCIAQGYLLTLEDIK